MKGSADQASDSVGLLAIGTSGSWEVSIDEALKGAERWYAQIEGPSVYLYFRLLDLNIVEKVLDSLEKRTPSRNGPQAAPPKQTADELTLGVFGRAPVLLIWDDEFDDRCFLVVGARSRSTMRVTLAGDDIPMLMEAFRQVREDLPSRPARPRK
ncbi:MAG TPA: hypothetical protein VEL76_38395 [Gemmataceae bacterium]|nr:hypothetical protein [Gemmataceae bacterium]